MYYILIMAATLLFSLQFMLVQGYQKLNGSSLDAAMKFSFESGIVQFIIMIVLSRFKLQFSFFSLFMALVNAVNTLTLTYCSNRALKTANLSVYSVFNMLGGMLLPFLYGILFFEEEFTTGKILCVILIGISVVLNIEKQTSGNKAFLVYMACFTLNGLAGVISKTHQSDLSAVSSESYLALTSVWTVVLSFFIILISTKKMIKVGIKELKYSAGNSLFNGIANLFLLIALKHVDASVQYPLVTGGVIVFSSIVSFAREKQFTKKSIAMVIISVIASIVVIF